MDSHISLACACGVAQARAVRELYTCTQHTSARRPQPRRLTATPPPQHTHNHKRRRSLHSLLNSLGHARSPHSTHCALNPPREIMPSGHSSHTASGRELPKPGMHSARGGARARGWGARLRRGLGVLRARAASAAPQSQAKQAPAMTKRYGRSCKTHRSGRTSRSTCTPSSCRTRRSKSPAAAQSCALRRQTRPSPCCTAPCRACSSSRGQRSPCLTAGGCGGAGFFGGVGGRVRGVGAMGARRAHCTVCAALLLASPVPRTRARARTGCQK